jgi:hypothetical protein
MCNTFSTDYPKKKYVSLSYTCQMRLIIVLLLSLLLLSQADVKRTKKELRRIERLREDSEVLSTYLILSV